MQIYEYKSYERRLEVKIMFTNNVEISLDVLRNNLSYSYCDISIDGQKYDAEKLVDYFINKKYTKNEIENVISLMSKYLEKVICKIEYDAAERKLSDVMDEHVTVLKKVREATNKYADIRGKALELNALE